MFRKIIKNKTFAGLFLGTLIAIFCMTGLTFGIFNSLHESFSNSLYNYNNPSKDIVIIAIDDKSTQPAEQGGFGRFSQWSREQYVELLDILKKENPKVITFDIVFHTHTTTIQSEDIAKFLSQTKKTISDREKLNKYIGFLDSYKYALSNPIDLKFAEKLKEFDNIILAATIEGNSLTKPLSEFTTKATIAFASAFLDDRGAYRYTIPIEYIEEEQRNYDSLAYAAAKKFLGKTDIPLEMEGKKMMANYFGDPYSFQIFSFVDIVKNNFPSGSLRDKIVLIGVTSSKELHDEYLTPRSNVSPMSGVEIVANQIQTILEGKFLQNQNTFGQFLTLLLISLGLSVLLNYLGIILSIIVSFSALLLYLISAHIFYRQGIILNMVYPFLAIVLSYLASWVYKYFIADKSKREIKSAFGHYLSKELVEQISDHPEMAKLGGEKRVVTILFADLQDSTKLSEKTEISSWVSQLNEYFTVMENVIKNSGGTIDKYEGDAIMAFWNAPVTEKDHAFRAYNAALKMKEMLNKLNQKWEKENRLQLKFRIGINTGEVIVGNMGSIDRFNYTVMGDSVNIASRLESSANKAYGTSLIVAGLENSLSEEQKLTLSYREVDCVFLPGKSDPIKLFEIIGLKQNSNSQIKNLIETYSKGLSFYRSKKFMEAYECFKLLPDDNPSKLMMIRCESLLSGKNMSELDERMNFKILNK